MRYRYHDLSFDAPEALVDRSMIVLVDGDRASLTLAREELDGPLAAYVDAVVVELEASMAGYRLEARATRTIAGRAAVHLVQSTVASDGRPARQDQAYIAVADGVLVVTVTAPADHGEHGRALFERVLASVELG